MAMSRCLLQVKPNLFRTVVPLIKRSSSFLGSNWVPQRTKMTLSGQARMWTLSVLPIAPTTSRSVLGPIVGQYIKQYSRNSYIYLILKYFQEHIEDVKRRLGKSLVEAGGDLLENEISGGSNSPSCSNVLIFVPAIAMYGLLLILTVVGKYTVWGQKICNFPFRKLSHYYGQSHLSLDTMGSHV